MSRAGGFLPALGIVALALLAYLPALRAKYVWDDWALTHNGLLDSGGGLLTIWLSPGSIPNEQHYWPMTYTVFWIAKRLWGLNPFGYHLLNVLLHTVNSCLVMGVVRRLGMTRGAWLAGAVFALHPVHVESVAWVIELKDVLSAFFYLSAFALLARPDGMVSKRGHIAAYWGAVALYALAMLSKSVAVTLPVALLIVAWWKDGRPGRRMLLHMLPFVAVGLAILVADAAALRATAPPGFGIPFTARVLIASRAFCFYLGKMVWPYPLMTHYPEWTIDAGAWRQYLYPLGVYALLTGLWLARGRVGRGPLATMLVYGVTLAPMLGFVEFSFMSHSFVADRFQYLASAAPIIAVAAWAAAHASGWPTALRRAGAVAVALVLVVLGILTWRQAGAYLDTETLFRDTLAKNPASAIAHFNLADILSQKSPPDHAGAAGHYRAALDSRPEFMAARLKYALELDGAGMHAAAMRELRIAERVEPGNAEVTRTLSRLRGGQ